MKKLLLSLLAFIAFNASAMVEETVTFDFTNPLGMTFSPALPPLQDTNGNILNLSNPKRTASVGPISVEFGVGQGNLGPAIYRYTDGSYTLNIRKWSTLTFSASNGCHLTKIQFLGVNALTVPTGQKGRFNPAGNYWYNYNDTDVESVMLEQGFSDDSQCPKIVVTYERPATPLTFSYSSPANGSTVQSFKTMTLHFSPAVANMSASAVITLTGTGITGSKTMSASLGGSTVTLTAPETIVTDGEYTVTVPAQTFYSSEGASNTDPIVIKIKVLAKRDTFNPTAIDPTSGTVDELPQAIKLTFDNFVKIPETTNVKFVQKNGTLSFPGVISVDQKVATISHEFGAIVEASQWEVQIPEKTFHNPFIGNDADDRWNAAMTLTYTVDGTKDGPQDSETMKAAKELLQQTGVGYAKETSEAYLALKALTTAEETPTDEALQAAMTALYNSTDVNMPVVGSWYKIAGVNAAGSRIYLTFNEEQTAVGLGTRAPYAAAFKVSSIEGNDIVFETKDGLFLHVLTTLPMREGTSSANLTEEQTGVNTLKFEKFMASDVEGADPKALYGAFTMYGSLGTMGGTEAFAYALLDFNQTLIVTNVGMPKAFGTQYSSAFVLEETTEPTTGTIIIPSVGLRPDAINEPGDEMLLVVNGFGIRKTTIVKKEQICFKKNGEKVDFTGDILTETPTENQFAVNTAGLAAGSYTIEMPLGTFSYDVVAGKTVQDKDLSANFYIRNGGGSSSTSVTPDATLSAQQLSKPGEQLTLTINKVKKAVMTATAAPYYEYADGDKTGQKVDFTGTILTPVNGSDNSFNVNTTGLDYGSYKLVMPEGTFTYAALEDGVIVEDVEMAQSFTIASEPSTGFNYNYSAWMVFMPALHGSDRLTIKDVELNEVILYIYDYMGTGMEPNKDAKVYIVDASLFGTTIGSGHFEKYTTFAKDYGSEYANTYAIKFVADQPVTQGRVDNYHLCGYAAEMGAFGDANYGKWLANHDSVAPEECSVFPGGSLGAMYEINNDATGIRNINFESGNQVIYDLQGRRVQSMDKKGIYVINGNKYVKK